MPRFLDTTGKTTLGIGICARCKLKFSLTDLFDDPNAPGLKVCKYDRDALDPYRLPMRSVDEIVLPFARPDEALGIGPQPLQPPLQFDGVTQLNPSTPWAPTTFYVRGAEVTPINPVGFAAAGQQIFVFVCITPGISGAVAPAWPTSTGVTVHDGAVVWSCLGLYLP